MVDKTNEFYSEEKICSECGIDYTYWPNWDYYGETDHLCPKCASKKKMLKEGFSIEEIDAWQSTVEKIANAVIAGF